MKALLFALIVALPVMAAEKVVHQSKPMSAKDLKSMQNQAFCKLKGLSDKMKKAHGCK